MLFERFQVSAWVGIFDIEAKIGFRWQLMSKLVQQCSGYKGVRRESDVD